MLFLQGVSACNKSHEKLPIIFLNFYLISIIQFFDYEDGNFAYSISDNMAMDMDSGELHIISGWSNDEDDD